MHIVYLRVLLALLSAFLLGLSFPFSSRAYLIWIALVPLLLALRKTSPRAAFLLSSCTGVCYYLILHQWASIFGTHVWFAPALWQGLYIGIWGMAVAAVIADGGHCTSLSRLLLPPLYWVAYEYIKSLGPLGVNWGSLAYSQYTTLPLIQMTSITGLYGLSFLIALTNMSIAELIVFLEEKRKKLARPVEVPLLILWSMTLLCLGAALLHGFVTIQRKESLDTSSPTLKIGLVQPNMDILMKWDKKNLDITIRCLEKLTREAEKQEAELAIWPETGVPTLIPYNKAVKEELDRFASSGHIYFLAGAPRFEPPDNIFNTVFLFSPAVGIIRDYSKLHLVPFGEYLPLKKYLRKYSIFERVQNLSPGRTYTLFSLPRCAFAVLICFESDFPELARSNVQKGAQFLVVVTNDAWFEKSAVATHHISWDVFRAVENNVPLVQSGNTGICAFIDCTGKIRKQTGIYSQGILLDEIRIHRGGTFYTRHGDLFVLLCFIVIGACVVRGRSYLFKDWKKGKKEKTEKQR